jgi:predicted Zn-dependent protease
LRQDWKSAAAAAAELAGKFPANPDVLDAQGRVQIASGNAEGALTTYKRAYELAPNSAAILSRYLALLTGAKKFAEARTVLQAALDRDPKNASVKGDLIRIESEIGGVQAGLAKARDFARNDPENSLYDIVSAELYDKAGQTGEGVALLEKAVAARPADDGLVTALSRLYVRSGDPAKGETVLKTRLQADPKDLAVRSALASFHLEQKNYDSAITEYTGLVSEHPADAAALNNLAWLYQQKGDLKKARELAERAVAAAPRAAQIDDTFGWILLAQGEADKAITYLSAASLSAPRNPDIQYHLAVALHRTGRAADAQATLESLLGSGVPFSDKAAAEKLLQQLKRG